MSNGQKTYPDYPLAWLDIDEIELRLYQRRRKILDGFTIDNVDHIDYQLSYLSWEQLRDLMALFRCSIWQLSFAIKKFKEQKV